jgi:hypothetical protein
MSISWYSIAERKGSEEIARPGRHPRNLLSVPPAPFQQFDLCRRLDVNNGSFPGPPGPVSEMNGIHVRVFTGSGGDMNGRFERRRKMGDS